MGARRSAGRGYASPRRIRIAATPSTAAAYRQNRPKPVHGASDTAVLAAAGLLLAAPWLARLVARADEAAGRALLGPSRNEALALRVESLARSRADPIERLTPRELHVLRLMAEGRSNNGIVEALRVSPSAVEKYVTNIFLKLDLPPTGTDHRRVLAVLKYLGT
jgi:DNA-binding NarL/FixJ family response regulator